ncbi:PIG-H domain-containing protein [Cephalotus follicularis]|uniref:PIG-H domain-containing protein n=1 Tax=Cephalotus follicularis TaxID=3775 RepID=A0A1Q3D760_CEPFO|nr:PIG-H domain-containing protein [Cephalotus follicularis]
MSNIRLASARYIYMHDDVEEACKKVDTHHIVFKRRNFWVFLVYIFVFLLSMKTLDFCLGIDRTAVLWSMLFGARLVYSFYQTRVVKESVVIIPAFGVQLETHFWSGGVVRNFIPVDKILKPVLNEHLTPFTCHWSLALVIHGKEELVLAFKELHLPVKMLAPIWKALCVATGRGESTDRVSSEVQ